MCKQFKTSIEDWHVIYSLSFCITKDTKHSV